MDSSEHREEQKGVEKTRSCWRYVAVLTAASLHPSPPVPFPST